MKIKHDFLLGSPIPRGFFPPTIFPYDWKLSPPSKKSPEERSLPTLGWGNSFRLPFQIWWMMQGIPQGSFFVFLLGGFSPTRFLKILLHVVKLEHFSPGVEILKIFELVFFVGEGKKKGSWHMTLATNPKFMHHKRNLKITMFLYCFSFPPIRVAFNDPLEKRKKACQNPHALQVEGKFVSLEHPTKWKTQIPKKSGF